MIDTSVLAAGIAGFKSGRPVQNPSVRFLRDWLEHGTFTWLVCEEILAEYKGVLRRLGVRRDLIGAIINLLREEAKVVDVRYTTEISGILAITHFACAEEGRAAFIATLNA